MSWLSDLFYPYTEPEQTDEIGQGFADGLLTRWDIPWGESDEDKNATLLGILRERREE
jgi:hypothetical protein